MQTSYFLTGVATYNSERHALHKTSSNEALVMVYLGGHTVKQAEREKMNRHVHKLCCANIRHVHE